MKIHRNLFAVAALVFLIVPQIALAAWWNPFSWSIFHRSETKTQVLENRAKKLNEDATSTSITAKVTKQSQTTNAISVTKTGKAIGESTQTTTVKLSNLNSFIDSAIALYESDITYANQIVGAVDFYDSNLRKGRAIVSDAINHETEPYWKGAWELILTKGIDDPLKYYADVRSSYLDNIRMMENSVATLKKEKEKNLLSEPVSIDRYWAYYDELKGYITVEQFTKKLSDGYSTFEPYAKKTQSDLSSMMAMLVGKETAYYKSLVDGYSQINASRQATSYQPTYNYYQPVVYPQIQMPQTTNCTISSGGGTSLQAYVRCSTSSF